MVQRTAVRQKGDPLPVPREEPNPSTGGAAVSICCALPNGIWLQIWKPSLEREATPQGFREITIHRPDPDKPRFRINGFAVPFGKRPNYTIIATSSTGGIAITNDVPRDLWEQWLEQNKQSEIVKKNIIFAMPSHREAEAEAKKRHDIKSGLEPIDPDKPPQAPEGFKNKHITLSRDDGQ
jgi:hypothetical protein